MIIGVGIDIVDIDRIDSLLAKLHDRFIQKIFTQSEIDFCYSRVTYVASFAKMFAMKEAMIKALSDAHGISWHDMEVSHDNNGKPVMTLSGLALENLVSKTDKFNIQVSVSDEAKYAVAYVIIESLR